MSSRPRVLQIVSSLGTYGAEQLVMQLARRLPDAEIESGVMTIYTPDAEIVAQQAQLDVPLIDMHRSRRFELEMIPRMTVAIRRWKPDIVHTHTRYGRDWGRVAALCARVPAIVYTEHDNAYRDRPFYKLVNRMLHPRTRAFVTFSRGHRERFAAAESVPLERIRVIANGIEPPPFEQRSEARAALGIDPAAFVMLRAARLHESKNHELGIRAVAEIPAALRSRLVYLIAGDGHLHEPLARLAEELGVASNVRLLGFRRDVRTLMAAADACVFTSLYEGMPITLIEAMFAKVDVLTTPWAGAADMLDGGSLGTVVPDFTPGALAAAVAAAAQDPDAARARAERAYAHAVAVHDIARTSEAHAALYRALV